MTERSLLIVGPGTHFTTELATRFAWDGYNVGLLGRSQDTLTEQQLAAAENGVDLLTVQADVTNDDAVAHAMLQFNLMMPPWQTIIYNVKDSPRGDLMSLSTHELSESLKANVGGVLNVAQFAVSMWSRTPEATIMLSGGGYKDHPDPDKLALSIGKGAMHTLALAAKPALNQHNVRLKEIVIDGYVSPEGPLHSADVADYYKAINDSTSSSFVHTFPNL